MRVPFAVGMLILATAAGARADATLDFRLAGGDGAAEQTLRIAVARFFARVEASAAPDGWWLYEAGKFFPLYRVNEAERTWTRLTPEVTPRLGPVSRSARPAAATGGPAEDAADAAAAAAAEPGTPEADQSPASAAVDDTATAAAEASTPAADGGTAASAPEFALTGESDTVAGVRCRVVNELRDGAPVIEHCMAGKAALGITERELRTLARTFEMARERDFGWLATATADEAFISVRSRALDGGTRLTLVAVSTDPLPKGHLRVTRDYREVPATASASEASPPPPGAAEADDDAAVE